MTEKAFSKLLARRQHEQQQTIALLRMLAPRATASDKTAAIAREHNLSKEDAKSFIADMENRQEFENGNN